MEKYQIVISSGGGSGGKKAATQPWRVKNRDAEDIPLLQVTRKGLPRCSGIRAAPCGVSGCKPDQGKHIPLPTGRQLEHRVCGIDGTNETGMASLVGPTAEITGALVLSARYSNCIISDQGGRRSRVLQAALGAPTPAASPKTATPNCPGRLPGSRCSPIAAGSAEAYAVAPSEIAMS